MRPATFRSSHTEKIADTSMKVIRARAAIKARMYGQYAARKSNTSTRSSEPESHEFGGCDGRYSIGGAKYRQAGRRVPAAAYAPSPQREQGTSLACAAGSKRG